MWILLLLAALILGGCGAPVEPAANEGASVNESTPARDDVDANEDGDEQEDENESFNVDAADDDAAEDTAYAPEIDPADFVAVIDNPYMPLVPGVTRVYESQTADGLERIEVTVLDEAREVMGVTVTIVRDTVTLDGQIIEDTHDWFAQDAAGNVWYFGEEVDNYENGQLADHAGSWAAGVDGAQPGIVMYADPLAHIDETYRQEYYPGEAEDMGRVLGSAGPLTVPFGTFDDVIQTEDWTPLEPGVSEHKFYARGVGVIKELHVGSDEAVELVEVITR
jgi:hypothetical protein